MAKHTQGSTTRSGSSLSSPTYVTLTPAPGGSVSPSVGLAIQRGTLDHNVALYAAIYLSAENTSFKQYTEYMESVLCEPDIVSHPNKDQNKRLDSGLVSELQYEKDLLHGSGAAFIGVRTYELVKRATETFLIQRCGAVLNETELAELASISQAAGGTGGTATTIEGGIENFQGRTGTSSTDWATWLSTLVKDSTLEVLLGIREGTLRDIDEKDGLNNPSAGCTGVLQSKLRRPFFLELIWSYWHEQGMLVQGMNMVALRFQNRRRSKSDPLASLALDPLRPLNNLLWGYIQDEPHRLALARRAYEYDHHYGLRMEGKAVPALSPADSRSRFLSAFHNLLRECVRYYNAQSNTFVVADAYPALNALKEVHLQLAEGQHNQYGDLPWTARVEMLIQQWLLARPEMREFLGRRAMVSYPEPWMPHMDTLKGLYGWTDVSVRHFHELATFGEKLLLSIRFTKWLDETNQSSAAFWMDFWRPEIQGYLNAYRIVTGVDMAVADTRSIPPALLIAQPTDLIKQRAAGSDQPEAGGGNGKLPMRAIPAPSANGQTSRISPAAATMPLANS